MENTKSLFAISQEYLDIIQILEEEECTPELETALQISRAELASKGTSYVHVIKKLENEIEGLKVYEEQIALIKKRKNKVIEKLKTILLETVNQFGDIEGELFKITTRKSESVEITDSEKIPASFLDVKVTQTPKKAEIKAAIKKGVEVPGAELVENKNLSIR